MKLYFSPATRAVRPRWLLEEIGAPYELVTLDMKAGEHKRDDYLAIHPLGVVPALVDGDRTIVESAAICLYLADRFPDANMAPPVDSPDRGLYYQWMVMGVATMEPALFAVFRAQEAGDDEALAKAKKQFEDTLDVVERGIRGPFLFGDLFTAADVMVGSMGAWVATKGMLQGRDALQKYVGALTGRPAFVKGVMG